MPRNWLTSLRRASFGGVGFWVDKDSISTGRRLVVHQFPHRDDPYVEDMGRDANKVSVTAYLASDTADSEQRQLRSACETQGPKSLLLPLGDQMLAHCESCKRDFNKDKLGHVAFDLQFVVDGLGAAPYPAAYLSRLVAVAAPGVASAAATVLGLLYNGLGVASWVQAQAADEIVTIAATIDAARLSTPLDTVKSTALGAMVRDMIRDADMLAASGSAADRITARSYIATGADVPRAPVAERIFALLDAFREAGEPADVAPALYALTSYGTDTDTRATALASVSAAQADRNTAAIAQTTRLAAITAWVVALTDADYGDRVAALQARADIAETIESEMLALSGAEGHAAHVALGDLRAKAVAFFSRVLLDLSGVLEVDAAASMPALWWAQRIYGDHERAAELVARNRVIHPAFMPRTFEALAV